MASNLLSSTIVSGAPDTLAGLAEAYSTGIPLGQVITVAAIFVGLAAIFFGAAAGAHR